MSRGARGRRGRAMFKGLACWIAYRLPVEVVYFAVMRALLGAAFGDWPDEGQREELRSIFGLDDE